MSKEICLGTAMWGWSVTESDIFKILDMYYLSGGRYIDTAYNYPINSDCVKLSFAANIVSQWIKVNQVKDLKVIFKFGSINNKLSSLFDLSDDAIDYMYQFSNKKFGVNLYSMMVHWDERSNENDIFTTLNKLTESSSENKYRIGISGIKDIHSYQNMIKKLGILAIDHEVKHSFLDGNIKSLDLSTVTDYRLWAYGISGSGLKLSKSEYRDDSYIKLVRPSTFHNDTFSKSHIEEVRKYIETSNIVDNIYEYSILKKERDNRFFGYIIAPRNSTQMSQLVEFRKRLITTGNY